MNIEEATKKLRNKIDNWNKCKKDICSMGELYEDIDEENIAIDIVLNELDNRIPIQEIEKILETTKQLREKEIKELGISLRGSAVDILESILKEWNKE